MRGLQTEAPDGVGQGARGRLRGIAVQHRARLAPGHDALLADGGIYARLAALPSVLIPLARWIWQAVLSPFIDFFARHGWLALLVLALIASYRISDIVLGVIANVFYVDMGFSKTEVANVTKVFGVAMTLLGAVIGGVLVIAQFVVPLYKARDQKFYVTLWYFTSGLVWLALTYLMGNIMPEWMLPGASGAAVTGLFIHDLVGLYVTPMGWGLMYFFVPLILQKPIWSHSLRSQEREL